MKESAPPAALSSHLRQIWALIEAVLHGRDHLYNSELVAQRNDLELRERIKAGEHDDADLWAVLHRDGGAQIVMDRAGLTEREQWVVRLRSEPQFGELTWTGVAALMDRERERGLPMTADGARMLHARALAKLAALFAPAESHTPVVA